MSNIVKQAEVSGYTGYKSFYCIKRLSSQSALFCVTGSRVGLMIRRLRVKVLFRLAEDVITWTWQLNNQDLLKISTHLLNLIHIV